MAHVTNLEGQGSDFTIKRLTPLSATSLKLGPVRHARPLVTRQETGRCRKKPNISARKINKTPENEGDTILKNTAR